MKILLIFVELGILAMSAVCSGLNVALMSLEPGDLKRKAQLGNKAAKKVLPLRRNSHLSLASILLANVAVISASSLVLHYWFNGFIAGALSTLLIVIIGEVVPQALFTRYALKLTALFAPLWRFLVIFTYPISKPLQLLLDKLFGQHQEALESRSELGLLIAEHTRKAGSELDEDEVEIMHGALSLSQKRVRDIMTPLKKVYWLKPQDVINADKIDEIRATGFSRIPVFDEARTKCYGVMLLRDLVDIDFDDQSLVVGDITLHPTKIIGSMTALDTIFRAFIAAHTHLMPVERDDKLVGILTIEDLIEEIIGHEIVDESDKPN